MPIDVIEVLVNAMHSGPTILGFERILNQITHMRISIMLKSQG